MHYRGKGDCRKVNRRDAGQILPMVAVVLLVVALMGLLVVRFGMQVDRRAQAQAAADAVALAGAAEGEDVACELKLFGSAVADESEG